VDIVIITTTVFRISHLTEPVCVEEKDFYPGLSVFIQSLYRSIPAHVGCPDDARFC
jgi:hypothetical protein